MAPPTTLFPVAEREVFIVQETLGTPGTIPSAGWTPFPVTTFKPSDKFTWLDDTAVRGVMGDKYARQPGPLIAGLDVGGPFYFDTIPAALYNILGDYTSVGTAAAPTTTLSAPASAGATSIIVTSATGITASQYLQLDTNSGPYNGEVVQVSSAYTTGTTIPLTTGWPTRFAHASTAAVTGATAPYTHVFALLNTSTSVGNGAGQPITHSLTDRTGIPATGLAAQYGYCCWQELTLTGNSEKFLEWSGKVVCLSRSIPGSAFSIAQLTGSLAQPSWRSTVKIGSGGSLLQRSEIAEWAITISRKIKPLFTNQGANAPYVIPRGVQAASGKLTVMPAIDESYLVALLANTQPQTQYFISNGLTGANLLSAQVDILESAYQTADIAEGEELFGYDVPFDAIHSGAAGISTIYMGGNSWWNTGSAPTGLPGGNVKVTITNAVPSYFGGGVL
jgi:hypothetical protein